MKRTLILSTAAFLAACSTPAPECNSINPYHPCHRWQSNGAGGMTQSPSGPSVSNNPGGLTGGGQVGNPGPSAPGKPSNPGAGPSKPGKGDSKPGHGGKPGKGHGHGKGKGK